jgi:site-specific recombinase XerD
MYSLIACINFYINELLFSNHAKSTIEAYKGDLNQFKDYINSKYKGIRKVSEIKVTHISQFRQYLLNDKNFSEKTIKRKIDCLRAFFAYLKEYDYIQVNPTLKLIQNKLRDERLPRYLDYREIHQIINTAKVEDKENGKRNVALLYCLAFLGCRRSEILQLDWSDINFFDATISIYRIKNKTTDILPIQDGLKNALKQLYIENRPDPEEAVFISQKGHRLSRGAIKDFFQKRNKTNN